MKRLLRSEWFLRLWTLVLGALLAGAILAQAPTTNAPATNSPASPALANPVTLNESQRAFIAENRSLLTFGLDHVELLQTTVFHRPLWQYLATFLYILIAFQVARFVDWLIHTRLRKLAERTETEWDDIVLGLVDGPVKVIVFVILLNIGLQLFDWPSQVELWFARLTVVAVAVSVVMVIMKAVDAAIRLWRKNLPSDGDRAFNDHFLILIGKAAKISIAIVATFSVLGNLGFDIRAALASVSVLGLALGLAAQDTVGNLFGAVAVFLDKPFKIGDRVRIGEVDGTIEEMGLRSTRIRNVDGFLVTVPNKEVGNARIVNITRRPTIRACFGIGLTYDTPAARVRRAADLLEEILKSDPDTHDYLVHFNKFGDFSLNLDVVYWCRKNDFREFTRIFQRINLTIKERFDAEGLRFAFPTQTIQIESTSGGLSEGASGTATTR
ncbi:MAG: mechanosensitive ion channel family protein [Verrucomicrobiales bacterium]|nr:mechanosensitive ion channel family protein [Verrucomicrobiales bacterium]